MTADTAQSHFKAGLAAHHAGDLSTAERAYRDALALDAGEARATQMLGVLALQTGRGTLAIDLLRHAVTLAPESADCYGHLGLALASADHGSEAIAAYRRAIVLKPDFGDAHVNLGAALQRSGDTDGAADAYRRGARACPDLPEAHFNLGLLLAASGRLAEAVAPLRRACDLRPRGSDEHLQLGDALAHTGELEGAVAAYRRAVALQPDRAEASFNLSIALRAMGRPAEAIAAAGRAVELRPGWAEAWNNLGVWLLEANEPNVAAGALARAIAARPGYAEAHCNLANVWRHVGRMADAIAEYRHAVTLRPGYAEAWSNLGSALTRSGDVDGAIDALRAAIGASPEMSEARNNLGNALKDAGDLDGALACFARAVALRPDDAAAHSNWVYTLLYHPGTDGAAHRDAAVAWARRHAPNASSRPARSRRSDRIRIGYVAPDFRDHCQSLFTLPLLSNHDRSRFEVFCYADVPTPDDVTRQIQQHANGWRGTTGLSDAAVADQITADGIDVLVDLTVHMANHRLGTFARRPAPVQVTWLGYPGTTGVDAIDFRLSDPHLDPPGAERDAMYTERTIRLADTFWCYDPLTDGPPITPRPADANGFVTFGCLNNFCKVTGDTLALWGRVMMAVPDGRLLLLAPEGSARRRVLDRLAGHGVAGERVSFVGRQSRAAYLRTYGAIDVGLDTFPYNGHTTSLDAYWMGVPVVTTIGEAAVGRAGWSQLSNLGLRDLAAASDDSFVKTAAHLAGDVQRLRSLRSTLRARLTASPLCDAPRFARNMETAFAKMLDRCSAPLSGVAA